MRDLKNLRSLLEKSRSEKEAAFGAESKPAPEPVAVSQKPSKKKVQARGVQGNAPTEKCSERLKPKAVALFYIAHKMTIRRAR